MANNGFWSQISCQEIPDGKGNTDIKFATSARQDDTASGSGGRSTHGVAHSDSSVEGEVVQSNLGTVYMRASTYGDGSLGVAPEQARATATEQLKGPADACRRILKTVPTGPAG